MWLTLASLGALLFSEYKKLKKGIWIAKPLASTGFLLFAWQSGALHSGTFGKGVLVALFMCFLGDLLLIPKNHKKIFKVGILFFLLGHVAYITTFLIGFPEFSIVWAVSTAVPVAIIDAAVIRWLIPKTEKSFQVPVVVYIVVISIMVITAAGVVGATYFAPLLIAALMFYFSDLAVARQRFVKQEFINKLIGQPLYYFAQLIFAFSVYVAPIY